MPSGFSNIQKELMEYKINPNRKQKFNTEFIALLQKDRPEVKYYGSLFKIIYTKDDQGNKVKSEVLDFERLLGLMD